MYPLYNQYMAEEHRQTLEREAEMVRRADRVYPDAQEKVLRGRISYVLLGGQARSNYDPSPFNAEQAYSDAYVRTKALVRAVGLLALGVGVLLGSWLGNSVGLLIPVLFGGIISLMIAVPIAIRLSVIFRGRMV